MTEVRTTPPDPSDAERDALELRAEERVERDIFLRAVAIVLIVVAVAVAGALSA
jgi:hypothetical protein